MPVTDGPDVWLALSQSDVSALAERLLAPWLDSVLIAALLPPAQPGEWVALRVSERMWSATVALLDRALGRLPAIVSGVVFDGLFVFTPAPAGTRVVDGAVFAAAPLRLLSWTVIGAGQLVGPVAAPEEPSPGTMAGEDGDPWS